MVSSETTHLPVPSLPPSAKNSHGFNHMASRSLFSVGQACNHNCIAVFDQNSVKTSEDITEVLQQYEIDIIQMILGIFLYYALDIDNTILPALGDTA